MPAASFRNRPAESRPARRTSLPTLEVTRVRNAGGADGPAAERYLRQHLRRLLPLLPRNRLRHVSVALVGDAAMSALHARSHGLPTPTDVLTYPLETTPGGDVTEGEIVICVPEARRNAGAGNIACRRELLLYALHGLLHLCGMDDHDPNDARRMHAEEDRLLTRVGVGPVYAGRGHRPPARRRRPRSAS
ncbi:MAG: rRNA maturation RNase YbeY [Tepidisphaerales bacterium]